MNDISHPIHAGPPHAATVVARTQESPGIFTLQLRLDDAAAQASYRVAPGQFFASAVPVAPQN